MDAFRPGRIDEDEESPSESQIESHSVSQTVQNMFKSDANLYSSPQFTGTDIYRKPRASISLDLDASSEPSSAVKMRSQPSPYAIMAPTPMNVSTKSSAQQLSFQPRRVSASFAPSIEIKEPQSASKSSPRSAPPPTPMHVSQHTPALPFQPRRIRTSFAPATHSPKSGEADVDIPASPRAVPPPTPMHLSVTPASVSTFQPRRTSAAFAPATVSPKAGEQAPYSPISAPPPTPMHMRLSEPTDTPPVFRPHRLATSFALDVNSRLSPTGWVPALAPTPKLTQPSANTGSARLSNGGSSGSVMDQLHALQLQIEYESTYAAHSRSSIQTPTASVLQVAAPAVPVNTPMNMSHSASMAPASLLNDDADVFDAFVAVVQKLPHQFKGDFVAQCVDGQASSMAFLRGVVELLRDRETTDTQSHEFIIRMALLETLRAKVK